MSKRRGEFAEGEQANICVRGIMEEPPGAATHVNGTVDHVALTCTTSWLLATIDGTLTGSTSIRKAGLAARLAAVVSASVPSV